MELQIAIEKDGDGTTHGIGVMNDTGSNLLSLLDFDLKPLGDMRLYRSQGLQTDTVNAAGRVDTLPLLYVQVRIVGQDFVPIYWLDQRARCGEKYFPTDGTIVRFKDAESIFTLGLCHRYVESQFFQAIWRLLGFRDERAARTRSRASCDSTNLLFSHSPSRSISFWNNKSDLCKDFEYWKSINSPHSPDAQICFVLASIPDIWSWKRRIAFRVEILDSTGHSFPQNPF